MAESMAREVRKLEEMREQRSRERDTLVAEVTVPSRDALFIDCQQMCEERKMLSDERSRLILQQQALTKAEMDFAKHQVIIFSAVPV